MAEDIHISLNLDEASGLYIILANSTELLKLEINKLKALIPLIIEANVVDEKQKAIKEQLEYLGHLLEIAESTQKQAGEVVVELDRMKTTGVISKPVWDKETKAYKL